MQEVIYTPTEDFKIEKCPLKTPQMDLHYHHAYQVYYVIDGEREYLIGDTFFNVSKGDLVWVPMDTMHCTDGKGAARYILYFGPAFIDKYIQPHMKDKLISSTPFVFHGDSATDVSLNKLFTSMLSEYERQQKQPQYADELLLAGYLLQFLFMLYMSENLYRPMISEDSRMSKIVKYINENYASITGMEEIANKFYVSKYYLCRLFKENIGVSFVSYLNTVKIRAACELLRTKKISLAEIATRCGFNSTPYFCKVFKNEKGVSPSEYRNQLG